MCPYKVTPHTSSVESEEVIHEIFRVNLLSSFWKKISQTITTSAWHSHHNTRYFSMEIAIRLDCRLTDGFHNAAQDVVTGWFSTLHVLESCFDAVPCNLSDGSGCLSVHFSLQWMQVLWTTKQNSKVIHTRSALAAEGGEGASNLACAP